MHVEYTSTVVVGYVNIAGGQGALRTLVMFRILLIFLLSAPVPAWASP